MSRNPVILPHMKTRFIRVENAENPVADVSEEQHIPIVFEGDGQAAVIMQVDEATQKLVREAAASGAGRTLTAWDYTNFIAVWCDLAVLDPTLLREEEWCALCELFGSYVDVQFRMLLVKPSPYAAKLPNRNVIHAPVPLTAGYLRDQMLRAAKPPQPKAAWEKRERQIVRLMFMLKRLDDSVLRLHDVTDRFEVSLRTVQRDLEVLLMAGYIIIDGPEPGTYAFPKGYKAHDAFDH